MARWSLKDSHYLSVPGTEWEYKESDRESGRQARKIYEVPVYLNPKTQGDWNYPSEQLIIVSSKYDPKYPRDIIFTGPPTPDMEPIDEEAREISQGYIDRGAWKHPIEALNMTYSESRLSEFERALAETLAGVKAQVPSVSTSGVSAKQFNELQAQVQQLMEQNARLQAQVLEKPKVRRI